MLPMLLPTTRSVTVPKESNACKVGICAKPFAPPPLSTKATLGFFSWEKTNCVPTQNRVNRKNGEYFLKDLIIYLICTRYVSSSNIGFGRVLLLFLLAAKSKRPYQG